MRAWPAKPQQQTVPAVCSPPALCAAAHLADKAQGALAADHQALDDLNRVVGVEVNLEGKKEKN